MRTNEKALRQYVKQILSESDNTADALRNDPGKPIEDIKAYSEIDMAYNKLSNEEIGAFGERVFEDYFVGAERTDTARFGKSVFSDLYVPNFNGSPTFWSIKSSITSEPIRKTTSGIKFGKGNEDYFSSAWPSIYQDAKYGIATLQISPTSIEGTPAYRVMVKLYGPEDYSVFKKLNDKGGKGLYATEIKTYFGEPSSISVTFKKPAGYEASTRDVELAASVERDFRNLARLVMKDSDVDADRLYNILKDELPPRKNT